jgi:hypothetical protein
MLENMHKVKIAKMNESEKYEESKKVNKSTHVR